MFLSPFKYLKLLSPHKSLTCFALCVWLLFPQIALAGKCTGSTNCKACTTCSSCRFCSVQGGTCGVCNHNISEKSSILKNPVGFFILGAGSLAGGLLVYRRFKKER